MDLRTFRSVPEVCAAGFRLGVGLAIGLGLGVGAALLSAGEALAQGRPAAATAAPVESRVIADTTPVIGRLVAGVESRVAARVAGVVEAISTAAGSGLDEGDEIARLDPALFEIARDVAAAALAEAEAGVKVAEAELAVARQTRARTERLRGTNAFSLGNFEDQNQEVLRAESALLQAQAKVASANADLARAAHDLGHVRIVAPFRGVVLERSAQPGQFIDRGEAAAVMLDPARIEIRADVPSELVAGLEPGDRLVGRFDAATSVEALVRSVVPNESVDTRTRPVRLTADFSTIDPMLLAAGRALTIEVPISAPRTVLLAPKDALIQTGGGWRVFVAENNRAASRRIEIGQSVGDKIEVVRGLREGELVVIRGNERLRDGQPLTVTLKGAAGPESSRSKDAPPQG